MSSLSSARVAVDSADGVSRIRDVSASAYLRPRVLSQRGGVAQVALVAACASLLGGDDLRLDIDVGPMAHLELVEPAGTVAYDGGGRQAGWSVDIRVAGRGSLVWQAAPFVVAQGADVARASTIELDDAASMLLQETLVLGRSGETPGRLRSTLAASQAGQPLLVEDLDLRDEWIRSSPALLGSNRVLTTVMLLGMRPDGQVATHETILARPGALRREVASHAHTAQAAIDDTWERWRKAITAGRGPSGYPRCLQ